MSDESRVEVAPTQRVKPGAATSPLSLSAPAPSAAGLVESWVDLHPFNPRAEVEYVSVLLRDAHLTFVVDRVHGEDVALGAWHITVDGDMLARHGKVDELGKVFRDAETLALEHVSESKGDE